MPVDRPVRTDDRPGTQLRVYPAGRQPPAQLTTQYSGLQYSSFYLFESSKIRYAYQTGFHAVILRSASRWIVLEIRVTDDVIVEAKARAGAG
jgi:hypothetical protein